MRRHRLLANQTGMSAPKISIVIPTFNRVARLREVIAALERQDYPQSQFEIIVISDGSTDGTNEFLTQHRSPARLQWQAQDNQGPAAARNAGIASATGEFIVFIDDDVVPLPQLLSAHMAAHGQAARDVVVLGPLLSPDGFGMAPWVRWEQAMLMKQYQAMLRKDWEPTARQFYTGNASLRRTHLLAAGGFDPTFRRAEDVELAYRLSALGLTFVFTMEAAGLHYAERSFQSWLDIGSAYGKNDAIFARDRNQSWIYEVARREFNERHFLVRQLIARCVGSANVRMLVVDALGKMAAAATAVGARRVERFAYSGLFNLLYYQGFCAEIGDSRFFSQSRDESRSNS